jgi:hypothetical protein
MYKKMVRDGRVWVGRGFRKRKLPRY